MYSYAVVNLDAVVLLLVCCLACQCHNVLYIKKYTLTHRVVTISITPYSITLPMIRK